MICPEIEPTALEVGSKVAYKWSQCNTFSISLWKVGGAEVSPKGRTFHFQRPFLVVNADFSLASSLRGNLPVPTNQVERAEIVAP